MEPFSFEHSHKFSEQEYVNLMRLLTKKTRPLRITIGMILGLAFLFWSYTVIFGIFIILFILLIPFLNRSIPGTAANNYKKIFALNTENLYGVNEKELWMKNNKSFVQISWKLTKIWDEKTGWLRICADSYPNFWFPIDGLKEAGVYQDVMKLCKDNAIRYDSKGNRKIHNPIKA